MLDKLFEFFTSFLDLFKFWQVIDEYERGVLLLFGKQDRELQPGFHWIWPFGVHAVFTDNVVPRATRLKEQSLTTSDDENIVITPVIEWRIKEIALATLEVEDLDTSLDAAASGVIGDAVASEAWDEIQTDAFLEQVTAQIQDKTKDWGVLIISVSFADCCPATSYRLWTGTLA